MNIICETLLNTDINLTLNDNYLYCSIPLLRGSKTLVGKRLEGSDAKWDVYLDIFTGLTWVLITLTLLLLTFGLVVMSEKERSGNNTEKYI